LEHAERGAVSSSVDQQSASNPKLPLGQTISRAYSIYFANFLDVLRASWLCIAITVPLLMIAHMLQFSWVLQATAAVKRGLPPATAFTPPSMPIGMMLLGHVVTLLALLAGVSIAVAWHRHIILGERPRLSGSNVVTISFWRYLGIGLAVVVTAASPLLIFLLIALLLGSFAAVGGQFKIPILTVSLFVVLYLVAIAIILRLCLLLPARAAGNWGPKFRDSWNRTRGNTWRLFWGFVACIVPGGLIMQFLVLTLLVLGGIPGPAPMNEAFLMRLIAVSGILWAYYLLTMPIAVGFLSLSYLHFFGPVGRGDPAVEA
jgi:hypothetical protein